jgi:hypothetical protein
MGEVFKRYVWITSSPANVPIITTTATNIVGRVDEALLVVTFTDSPTLSNPMYCLPKSFILPELSINAFAFKLTIWDQSTRRKIKVTHWIYSLQVLHGTEPGVSLYERWFIHKLLGLIQEPDNITFRTLCTCVIVVLTCPFCYPQRALECRVEQVEVSLKGCGVHIVPIWLENEALQDMAQKITSAYEGRWSQPYIRLHTTKESFAAM